MNIRRRIFVVVNLLLFCVIGMFGVTWYVSGLQKTDALVINLAGRQRMLTQKITKEYLLTLVAKDAEQKKKIAEQFTRSIDVFERTHNALYGGGPAPLSLNPTGPQGALPKAEGEASAKLTVAGDLAEKFLSSVRSRQAAGEMRNAEETELEGKLLGALNSAVEAMQSQSEAKVLFMLQAQAVCIALALAALLFFILMIRKMLFRPLDNLLNYATTVASGSYEAHPEGEYSHELLTLKDAMESMVGNLRKALDEASAHADVEARAQETRRALEEAKRQEEESRRLIAAIKSINEEAAKIVQGLFTSSEKLTAEVTHVTDGADRQHARLNATSQSMDDMNAALMKMSRHADGAAEDALAAKSIAGEVVAVVKSMLSATGRVGEEVISLRDSMSQLGKQVDGISIVMQIITDIADQTNLLALNAAIEAARAGDAGRGFAVVADEVRKLAEKTMEATSQVGKAVQAIQKDAQQSIQGVERAATQTEEAASLAQSSGASLDKILQVTGQTAEQIRAVAASSNGQSASSSAIRKSLEEVGAISNETKRGMEAAFKAIGEISAEAKGLHELISRTGKNSSLAQSRVA